MASVTNIIKTFKQPRGGFLKPSDMEQIQLKDKYILNENENIHSSLIGLVVDYMSRAIFDGNLTEAFKVSLNGAIIIKKIDIAKQLLLNIKGIDNISIINACKLVSFDNYFRTKSTIYYPIELINPNKETIENIQTMIIRTIDFLKKNKIKGFGFTFEGAYSNVITSGDGDFLSNNSLWDLKTTKNEITSKHTLQILIYYIMGIRSIHDCFEDIQSIGIFNPRLNKIYKINISNISADIIKDIEKKVICYDY